jgi:hypothetical protein
MSSCVNKRFHRIGHLYKATNSAACVGGVSEKFGECSQKTNNTEDTNKLTSLVFKIIAIIHNTLLATFIKFPETL